MALDPNSQIALLTPVLASNNKDVIKTHYRAAQEAGVPPVSILTGKKIKTHYRVAQEAGVPPVSTLTGKTKTQFSHLCSSVIPYLSGAGQQGESTHQI